MSTFGPVGDDGVAFFTERQKGALPGLLGIIWDAVVTHLETGKTIALFRCTQMVLWPKG